MLPSESSASDFAGLNVLEMYSLSFRFCCCTKREKESTHPVRARSRESHRQGDSYTFSRESACLVQLHQLNWDTLVIHREHTEELNLELPFNNCRLYKCAEIHHG